MQTTLPTNIPAVVVRMPSKFDGNYAQVLADLEAKRDAIEAAIAGIRRLMSAGAHLGSSSDGDGQPTQYRPAREFNKARYTSRLPQTTNPNSLTLSSQRKQTLAVVHEAGPGGVVAKEIIERSGLPHGSVQQCLRWLRDQQYINAQEDSQPEQPQS